MGFLKGKHLFVSSVCLVILAKGASRNTPTCLDAARLRSRLTEVTAVNPKILELAKKKIAFAEELKVSLAGQMEISGFVLLHSDKGFKAWRKNAYQNALSLEEKDFLPLLDATLKTYAHEESQFQGANRKELLAAVEKWTRLKQQGVASSHPSLREHESVIFREAAGYPLAGGGETVQPLSADFVNLHMTMMRHRMGQSGIDEPIPRAALPVLLSAFYTRYFQGNPAYSDSPTARYIGQIYGDSNPR